MLLNALFLTGSVSGLELSVSQTFSMDTAALWGRCHGYTYFTDEKTEGQRGEGTCPRSHCFDMAHVAGFHSRPPLYYCSQLFWAQPWARPEVVGRTLIWELKAWV